MIPHQITKIFYLIAEGYDYNSKLSKYLKKSKATINIQLNYLKKEQLIKGIKKPGNRTEYQINFEKLAEMTANVIKEIDQRYRKQKQNKEELNVLKIEKDLSLILNFLQTFLYHYLAFTFTLPPNHDFILQQLKVSYNS